METKDLTMDPEILRAALVGYQIRQDEVNRKIEEVKGMLAGIDPPRLTVNLYREVIKPLEAPHPAIKVLANQLGIKSKPKRQLSAAGREAIAAATKKRWKAWRKAQKNKAA